MSYIRKITNVPSISKHDGKICPKHKTKLFANKTCRKCYQSNYYYTITKLKFISN